MYFYIQRFRLESISDFCIIVIAIERTSPNPDQIVEL